MKNSEQFRSKRIKPSPRRPGKRAQNKEQTKKRILAAALALFQENGLESTTTRQISRRAGIAEGTLFNYFKTKEDLALYFFQRETDDLIKWFHSQTQLEKASLPERLFAIIHRQLEYIEPYEDFIGAVFFRALQPSSTLSPLSFESQELRLKYLRFIRSILANGEEKGEIPPVGDLGAYAVGLFYIGIVTHWLQKYLTRQAEDFGPGQPRTVARDKTSEERAVGMVNNSKKVPWAGNPAHAIRRRSGWKLPWLSVTAAIRKRGTRKGPTPRLEAKACKTSARGASRSSRPNHEAGTSSQHANAFPGRGNDRRIVGTADARASHASDADAAQFNGALGKYPEDMFRSFEPEPFAAASLGQVHWAVTKVGDNVAVKIQYPAMREAIESDFQALRTAGFAIRLTGHLQDSVIREAERGILEETDYVNEAQNIERFREALAPLGFVHVPKVHRDLSSDQVLTMSRVLDRVCTIF